MATKSIEKYIPITKSAFLFKRLALDIARHYLELFVDRVTCWCQWVCVCLCKTGMGKHRVGFKGKQNLLLWDEYADVEHAMDYVHISLSGANICVTEWHLSIMNILSSQAQQLSGGRTDFSSQARVTVHFAEVK